MLDPPPPGPGAASGFVLGYQSITTLEGPVQIVVGAKAAIKPEPGVLTL
jgi:hypothetical protein